MRKTWLIIRHEYLTNIKRRSFLFAAFGVPLMVIGLMVFVFAVTVNNEENVDQLGAIGYVDQAGVLQQQIDKPSTFQGYDNEDAAKAALNAGEVGAYFIVTPNYMADGQVHVFSSSHVPSALTDEIEGYLRANLGTGLDPQILERIKDPVESSIKTLDNGRVVKDSAIAGLIIAPMAFVMMFLFASQTTNGYLMSSVVEEKIDRIMELVVTSVTPFQLLIGKIIGLGLLGLTQLLIWIAAGYITLALGHSTSALSGITIPPDLLIVAVIYFLLGYFLMSSVMAGVGAVAGSEQESRQFAGIFTLILVIPFFLITNFFEAPNGIVVTVLSLFPLTSPIAVILRMGLSTIPPGQLLLSMGLLLFTGVLVAWTSARVFRWGLLLYGKRPSPRELLRVIRSAPTMATTATGDRTA